MKPGIFGDTRMTVFIADDSQMICARIATLLSDLENVEIVGAAHTADSAVNAISDKLPDVVIVDFHLSGSSGVEVLKAIRKSGLAIRIIMLTSYPLMRMSYEKLCMDEGADFCIDKSNDFQKLPDILTSLVASATTEYQEVIAK